MGRISRHPQILAKVGYGVRSSSSFPAAPPPPAPVDGKCLGVQPLSPPLASAGVPQQCPCLCGDTLGLAHPPQEATEAEPHSYQPSEFRVFCGPVCHTCIPSDRRTKQERAAITSTHSQLQEKLKTCFLSFIF